MKGIKVVTAKEMARIEKLAIANGCNEEEFVFRAGQCVADVIDEWIHWHHQAKNVVIIAGKGNKAADAFAAGVGLLAKGFRVQAYHLEKLNQCRPLCQKMAERFLQMGGVYAEIQKKSELIWRSHSLIIDGLLGTGFSGPVTGLYLAAIQEANQSHLPILSIDIPSGLDGSTGAVRGSAIQAQLTVAMGLPKVGFFLNDGWNFVGELYVGDFGLPDEFIECAKEEAFMPCYSEMHQLLPKLVRNRHKYQTGCVIGYAGSKEFSGAAKLASYAALRGGAGIVKLFFPPSAENHMMNTPNEVIRIPWSKNAWQESLANAKAVFVGSGIGHTEETKRFVEMIISKLRLPLVLDADALFWKVCVPPSSICTPHRGEALRLFGKKNLTEKQLFQACRRFCNEKKTILILKGAPTWIFSPKMKPLIMTHGDPGMATAGSGDVLTGLLAALLAQGCQPLEAAILGTMIHGLAGEEAAQRKTSHCLIASDLMDYFPHAFRLCSI